jgi:hypothetical protein
MLMKTLRVNAVATLFFMMVGGTIGFGQNQPEVPGDQFSLEGALELFKKSASPEEFERLLNSPNEKVNNLDLNGDREIDYIRVIDRNEGNVHAFILTAVISESESQDIAVIELEKLANGKAVLQITGDADIYGIETIIEPTQEVRINAGASTRQTVVNVWAWPSVQYVYSPYYSVWASPWHWRYRPIWWNPWRPIAYVDYYPYWTSYRPYYSICNTHRIVYAQNIYRPYRNTSVIVYNRHHAQISKYRSTRGDDYGRTRYNDGRSGRQNNDANGNRNGNNGRVRSYANERESSRSANDWKGRETTSRNSTSEWNKPNVENRRSSSVSRDESTLRNRSNADVKRESPAVNQNRVVQRQDTRERSNQAPVMRQRETRPTDTRSVQRTPQVQRQQHSTPNVQRSGNNGGGNKPATNKRGRN